MISRTLKRVYVLLITLSATSASFAQENHINDKLANFLEYRPQEKAYLHLNKHVFAAGEDIWFKVYLTDAISQKLSDLSKVLYVDLTDDQNRLMNTWTLRVKDGVAVGDISLSDSIPGGDYFIKTYTKYMFNYDPGLIPATPIRVISAKTLADSKSQNQPLSTDVQFFPESGELVAGLVNNIGFKAIDEKGLGLSVTGEVFDSEGNEITSFESEHAGMGSFKLIPRAGEHYSARVFQNNVYQDFTLPEVVDMGAIIQIKPDTDRIELKVLAKNYSLEHHHLVVYEKGHIIMDLKPQNGQNYIHTAFSTKSLPSGILYFTLFDAANDPIAERLTFVNNTDQLPQMKIECPDKIGNRKLINIGMQMDSTIDANLSMSVINLKSTSGKVNNILTYLLLTSDLKGNIEDPQFYFKSYNSEKVKLLDNLMMTQGWRRFTWKEVLSESLPEIENKLERSLSVSGELLDFNNPNKVKQGTVKLNVIESPDVEGSVDTGEDGKFEFQGFQFEDTVTITLQAHKTGKKEANPNKGIINNPYIISLDERIFPDLPDPAVLRESSTDEEDIFDIQDKIQQIEQMYGEEVVLLDAVEVKTYKNPFEQEKEQAKFYNNPSYRIVLDSLPMDVRNVSPTVQDMLMGLQIPNFDPVTLMSRGGNTTFYGQKQISVFYQGMIYGVESIKSPTGFINPMNIGAIDFFTGLRAQKFGNTGAAGVLVLYPRTLVQTAKTSPKILSFKFPGFYRAREFYTPNYEVEKSEEPDYRSTLYWDSDIILKKGKTNVSFYTSDERSSYIIDVQGITRDGEPVVSQKIFTVE